MISLALTGLETAINAYLRLDPNMIKQVAALKGKIIKVDITDWNIVFFVKPSNDGLHLFRDMHENPDTIIRGKLASLLRVGQAQGSNKALFDNAIEIAGDIDTGSAIREILQNSDIDWEEHLSKLVGDGLAHQVSYHAKKAINAAKKASEILAGNIKEYAFTEARLFPTQAEVKQFYGDVSCLRDDVDRVDARITRLLAQLQQKG